MATEAELERDDDGIDPIALAPEVALIAGLTRGQQDKVIDDFARRSVRNYKDHLFNNLEHDRISSKDYEDFKLRSLIKKDEIVDALQRLPEPMQDAIVLSTRDTGTPVFRDDIEYSGEFIPGYNKVTMKTLDPFALVHEYTHAANQDLNNYNPYYKMFPTALIPDRMAEINIGKSFDEDLLRDIRTQARDHILNKDEFMIDGTIERNVGLMPYGNARKNALNAVRDMITMHPYVDIQDNVIYGHDKAYKNAQVKLHKRTIPKSKKTAPYYAPLSIEGSAELAEVLASEDGEQIVKTRFPRSYERMMEEYRKDPRIDLIKNKKFVIPYLWTEDKDLPEYKYVPSEERDYFRVKSPYGGYVKEYRPARTEDIAKKLGRQYYEYRDLEGEWNRLYPQGLKNVNGAIPKRTFDETYSYYVETPYGRKGFKVSGPMMDWINTIPDLGDVYRRSAVRNPETLEYAVDEEGKPVFRWEKSNGENLSETDWKDFAAKKWKTSPEKMKKIRSEYRMLEKARLEKEAANAFKKMIRTVK